VRRGSRRLDQHTQAVGLARGLRRGFVASSLWNSRSAEKHDEVAPFHDHPLHRRQDHIRLHACFGRGSNRQPPLIALGAGPTIHRAQHIVVFGCVASCARAKWMSRLRQINPSGKSLRIYGNRVKPQNKKYFAFTEGRNSGISVAIPSRLEGVS
jgi:hypothetical protein